MKFEYVAIATYYIYLNIVYECKYVLNLLRGQYFMLVSLKDYL